MSVRTHLDQISFFACPTKSLAARSVWGTDLLARGRSFGFWTGDENVREASYCSYTVPEPTDQRGQPLQPEAASWSEQGGGSLALLPYDAVRAAADPRNALLAFLESAYRAGAGLSGWDPAAHASSLRPSPAQLSAILAGSGSR